MIMTPRCRDAPQQGVMNQPAADFFFVGMMAAPERPAHLLPVRSADAPAVGGLDTAVQ